MAWTSARTWTTSELVTASIMNTHIRDNLNYLYSGKEAIYIPASAWHTPSTSGAALSSVELTAGQPDIKYLAFDKDADEYAQIDLKMPLKWGLGTISFQVTWACASAVLTGIAFAMQGVAIGDGEQLDAAFGTAVVVTDDAQNATYDHLITAESSAVTISGTPADGDAVILQLFRDVSDANDDLAEDALVRGVTIFYTSDQHFEA